MLEVRCDDVMVYWTQDHSISALPLSDVTRSFDCPPIDPKELPHLPSTELVVTSTIETARTAAGKEPSVNKTRQPPHQLHWDVDARNGDVSRSMPPSRLNVFSLE